MNLRIPAGKTMGLVGVNGAGKSTLVKLLCRFWELERGQILWDGVEIRDLDVTTLRRRIAATFQDFMTSTPPRVRRSRTGPGFSRGDVIVFRIGLSTSTPRTRRASPFGSSESPRSQAIHCQRRSGPRPGPLAGPSFPTQDHRVR